MVVCLRVEDGGRGVAMGDRCTGHCCEEFTTMNTNNMVEINRTNEPTTLTTWDMLGRLIVLVILWVFMMRIWPKRVSFACAHARDIIKHNGVINVNLNGTKYQV